MGLVGIKPNNAPVDTCRIAYPNQIRQQPASGRRIKPSNPKHKPRDRGPECKNFQSSPKGLLKLEKENAPKNIQKSIDSESKADRVAITASHRSVPGSHRAYGGTSENNRPCRAKGPIGRLPPRLDKRQIPSTNIGRQAAKRGNKHHGSNHGQLGHERHLPRWGAKTCGHSSHPKRELPLHRCKTA